MRVPTFLTTMSRSDQAAAFVAAAGMPLTFQRTLMPRSTLDQGIITGASTALSFLATALVEDAVEAFAARVVDPSDGGVLDDQQVRRVSLALDAGAMMTGFALQMAFRQRPYEPYWTAAVRTGGYWTAVGGISALAVGITQEWFQSIEDRTKRDLKLRYLPAPLVAGGVTAAIAEFLRHRREALDHQETSGVAEQSAPGAEVSGARALAIGAGVSGGLFAFSAANRLFARGLGNALSFLFPGDVRLWQLAGRLASLGLLTAGVGVVLHRVNTRIEEGAGTIEPANTDPPESEFVSGGPGSLVSWATLSREGRRHVKTYVRREWIEEIMQEPSVDPIRVYVGLDSAPTEEERVRLAIAELQRTGAFERELLIVVSPTGTGYVNYVAIEAAECMTRGNCATVTLQYSKRPSPLSLDRVWEGRKHFRLLISAIMRELYQRPPDARPRVVLFGESLGAHTSQDAFLHLGTIGLQSAGVERALWIGSPHLSKWKAQLFGKERSDVEKELIGEFDNFEQIEATPPDARARLRYYFITHGNDAVGKFGPDLLIQQPEWLGGPESRGVGVPRGMKYRTPTTFFQTLIDMKNAMDVQPEQPGDFVAAGHDYSADLGRFVREAYALTCSDEQLARIEQALRRWQGVIQSAIEAQKAMAAAQSEKRMDGVGPRLTPAGTKSRTSS
ncbi:MAG: alpha/beta-hydrolase family protein [Dehalococcoidia bacterium]